ncbi:2-dehydropantoate 2-reductase [Entomortierella parvispora]|uniref:2-dehydropantoate 2-reductase n=1 Tax=Entomortierella parvispora TaxID=205924 RepID=A0A9P3H8I7_9FUNG|nr:2-dehydropantoate 2-reductase [Entomortierella parvispora]
MNRAIHHPRFHILGPGGIGSLCAYYFHQHNIPFTLFHRKAPPFPPTPPPRGSRQSKSPSIDSSTTGHVAYPPTTLKYMNLTALDTASVAPQSIDGIEWEPLYPIIDKELFGYDPIYNDLSRSPIHQLLVTTKTYQTVEALSKIRHRLRPWTTIVLMQNGMGVREEICESMGWTDNDWERPNFVQGVISHGAQKNGDTIIHTGKGLVWLAPVLDAVQSRRPKRPLASTSPVPRGSSGVSPTLEAFLAQGSKTIPDVNAMLQVQETSNSDEDSLEMKFPTLVRPASKDVRYAPYPYDTPATLSARFSDRPFSDFYTPPSSAEELLALRTRSLYETLLAFQQLSDDMSLTLIRPDQLLAIQLSKLIVNASVNPIATLLESTNGEIVDNKETLQAVKELLEESHAIMVQSPEYKALDERLKSRFLTLDALTKTTIGIMEATKQNRCSTLQDYLNGSTQCEIDYMNGYFVKMAARNAASAQAGDKLEGQRPVEAKLNKIVVEKVKEKFATAAASRSSTEK